MSADIARFVTDVIESKRDLFIEASDRIWEFAETRFTEVRSAELLCDALEREGFAVEREVAGLATAFVGSFVSGAGHPVIAFLGEFDALAGLSQRAGTASAEPLVPGANGHGCGHNLLGAGSFAAAVAAKEYLRERGLPGTVRYYGCPAEESGSGKTYMTRAGLFADVDAAFCWHPAPMNAVLHVSSLANVMVRFAFNGRSAHAAAAPHLGRSALDAVELMSVGVNYLREHIIPEARVHYAVTNTGGFAPNVVQAEAEVVYSIRAPRSAQVLSLYERIQDIARGAALMTGTTVKWSQEGGASNLIPNAALEKVMHRYLKEELELPAYTEEEMAFAKAIYDSLPEEDRTSAAAMVGGKADTLLSQRPLAGFVAPYQEQLGLMSGSTDVSDVSWNVPTAQCATATWAYATPFHAWQTVAQGKSGYAHKGMLLAGKAMACAGIEALLDPELLERAKAELAERLGGEAYVCPIPADVAPPRYERVEASE